MSPNRIKPYPRPPSDRDYSIFEQILVEGKSRKEVARDFNLSPQHVGKIAHKVAGWMAENVRADDPAMIHWTHIQRLEYQWSEAMNAWYESRGNDETLKVILDQIGTKNLKQDHQKTLRERKEKTIRKKPGDIRYLWHARAVMAEIRSLIESKTQAIDLENEDVETLDAERDGIRKLVVEAERLGLLPKDEGENKEAPLPPPEPDP